MATRLFLLVLCLCSGLVFNASAAQQMNWEAKPLYGTVNLEAGFTPDPHEVRIDAGGRTTIDEKLGPNCQGSVDARQPDVDLNYTAGSAALYIYVRATVDTTLAVYGPDNRWYCNDDFGSSDPLVVFQNPRSGNYNIWVGTYSSSAANPAARLVISEGNPLNSR
jgi:serine protease Do